MSEEMTGPYATISHCWGGFLERPPAQEDAVLVLDDDSEDRLTSGVLISKLPRTVQDVISTVRRLGIRRLWMDCYCIRQRGVGSLEDKQIQVAAMADVYANAILNISASSARDPFHGCFHPRGPSFANRRILWRPTSFHDHAYYRIASKQPPYASDFFTDMPLMTRGWVLQERVLSNYILHLCHDQVLWECKHLQMACEVQPYGLKSIDGLGALGWRLRTFNVEDLGTFGSRADNFDIACWGNLVDMYSGMMLSWPHDHKLAAISGIAKRVAAVSGDEYVAGLWRKTLVHDLCWMAGRGCIRPDEWRAPSWSWASIEGAVSMPPHARMTGEQDEVSVIDVAAVPMDPSNLFSALRSATLTLEGRLIDAMATEQDLQSPNEYGCFAVEASGSRTNAFIDKGALIRPTVILFITRSFPYTPINGGTSQGRCAEGIVLPRLVPGVYSRIGKFKTYGQDDTIFHVFMKQELVRFILV